MAVTQVRQELGELGGPETSAELRNIEKSLRELSQRQQGGPATSVRNSFLSVDSGMLSSLIRHLHGPCHPGRHSSDTYDTSNSSVSSQSTNNSNHSNRLNSTASNCSGDSGTQVLGCLDLTFFALDEIISFEYITIDYLQIFFKILLI